VLFLSQSASISAIKSLTVRHSPAVPPPCRKLDTTHRDASNNLQLSARSAPKCRAYFCLRCCVDIVEDVNVLASMTPFSLVEVYKRFTGTFCPIIIVDYQQ
jgi:hypothetical protein